MTNNLITPDFSEALDLGEQVAPGVYKARIDGHESKTSQRSGAPYLQWSFMIFGGVGEAARFNNRKVSCVTMLSGPGAGTLKSLLQATLGEARAFTPDELYGKEVQLRLDKNTRPDGTEGWPNVKAITAIKH